MKILTTNKAYPNNTIRFIDNILVKWNEVGESDVSEQEANILISQYADVFTEETYVKKQEEVKVNDVVSSKVLNKITELEQLLAVKEESLAHANRILSGEKSIRKDLESEVKVLRDGAKKLEEKIEQLLKENLELKHTIERGMKVVEDKSLKVTLSGKKKDELIEYCVELNLDEAEYKNLNKSELIDYIVTKVEDANN